MLSLATLLGACVGFSPHAASQRAPELRVGSSHRAPPPTAQWGGFKVQKSDRLLIREAWERADAYRPGKPNWFTKQPRSLLDLHEELTPIIDSAPVEEGIPGAGNVTSLIGALLKSLSTGDLALTLCSKEPPVLTELRDWLVEKLPMEIAVLGLPEEQARRGGGGPVEDDFRGVGGSGGEGRDASTAGRGEKGVL